MIGVLPAFLLSIDVPTLLVGFVLGIVASAIAALIYEHSTRPNLEVALDEGGRAQAQVPGNPPHEFYHLRIRNLPSRWPFPGRKPAWRVRTTLEVFRPDGSRAIAEAIQVRWTSHPEPMVPVIVEGQPANILDPAKVISGGNVDVHGHDDQQFAVAVKFDGEEACFLFNNLSYTFVRWQNPAWRLPVGEYRLSVTVYYERGRLQRDFRLRNEGTSLDQLVLSRWKRPCRSNGTEQFPTNLAVPRGELPQNRSFMPGQDGLRTQPCARNS